MLYCVRFHKRDWCSLGRRCRSVQGGITIFSHAACLEMQRGGTQYLEGTERQSNLQQSVSLKVIGQTFSSKPSLYYIFTECILVILRQANTFVSVIGQQQQNCIVCTVCIWLSEAKLYVFLSYYS